MQQPNPRLTTASLAGAVDLSSLRKPPPSSTPGGAAPGDQVPAAPPSEHVVEVTEANFQTEILERSLTTPVVIDFYAEQGTGSKALSALLGRLVAEAGGAWVLARVDVYNEQRLAAAFRVQSVPTVIAVAGGQPLDAFAGALPEGQLRQWLAAVVKAAGGEAPLAEEPTDARLDEADDFLQAGDFDAAEALYQAILADVPGDPLAAAGLAQLALFRRLEGIDPDTVVATADADPDDIGAQLAAADFELASGEAERAFARLVNLVRRTSGEGRDAARTRLLELFAMAAPDDPAVAKARRDLTSALF